jgi:hypothetical protein
MSVQDLARFQDLVLSDLALQQELRAYTQRDAFIDLVVQRGREHDCLFTAAEVEAAMQAHRRAWFEREIR